MSGETGQHAPTELCLNRQAPAARTGPSQINRMPATSRLARVARDESRLETPLRRPLSPFK
jgi:hypothetical protein